MDRKCDLLGFVARVVGKVLSVFPVERHERVSVGPRAKFLKSGGWHQWEDLGCGRSRCVVCLKLSSDPSDKPMLGCKGRSKTWRGVLDFTKGHTLAECVVSKDDVDRTLVVCTVCGAYTSARCRLLGKDCIRKPLSGARTTLRRIFSGLCPQYRDTSTVSSSSRRGAATLCQAASQVPREVGRVPPSSGLVQTPGMEALQARIRAREEAAAARSAATASRDAT